MIGRVLLEAVHPHRCRDERHVVDDGADQADDHHDHIQATDRPVEPCRDGRQQVRMLEHRNSEQDPDKEDNRTEVDPAQCMNEGQAP